MQLVVSCERPLDMWNRAGRAQQLIIKGGPHPNAGKLFVEFMLSKEGADIYSEGETLYSFRANDTPPESVQPYMFDMNKIKMIGLDDWISAQQDFKQVRETWQSCLQ
jgi:ABC-type Fe3+ transport system substrate-binding protein